MFNVLLVDAANLVMRVLSLGPTTREHEEKSNCHFAWKMPLHLPQERKHSLNLVPFHPPPTSQTDMISVAVLSNDLGVLMKKACVAYPVAHTSLLLSKGQTIGLARA